MKTTLVLVRHGESEHSVRRVAGGPVGDTGLTDKGRAQAARLATRLSKYSELRAASVYSSPLPRASETAQVIAAQLGSPAVEEHCGLCSYHVLPADDGCPPEDGWATARHGSGMALFRPKREGGDSWGQLALRAGEALHEIADINHGKSVIIVTHNETIQASLVVLGYLPFRARMTVSLSSASITEWSTEDDTTAGGPPDWPFADWTLVRLNDTAHLEV